MNIDPVKDAVKNLKLDTMKLDWTVILPKLKEKWNRLTDEDLKGIDGNVDMLVGKLVARYGFKPEDASREVDTFLRGMVTK